MMGITDFALTSPTLFIVLLSLVVMIVSTFAQKYLSDQERLKHLKKRQKELQKELKGCKDPKKLSSLNAEMFKITGETFRRSMRPTLFIIGPLLLIVYLMNAHLAYMGLAPGEDFIISASFDKKAEGMATLVVPDAMELVGETTQEIVRDEMAEWTVRGDAGRYFVKVETSSGASADKELVISNAHEYVKPVEEYRGDIESIVVGNEKIIYLNLFGWQLGWLGSYILLSIVFSLILRKLFKVA